MTMNGRVYAIFGAGCFGERLYNEIHNEYKIKFFVDNYSKVEKQKPVISPFELKYRYEKNEIDEVIVALSDYYALGDVLLELHELGVFRIIIVDPVLWKNYWEKGDECDDAYRWLYELDTEKKAVLTKLEFHVCDHCNLNCAGCSHFAPIYDESYADIKAFEKDVNRLSVLFSNILRFRLMGGEPFLNRNLDKFINVVRSNFPHTHLEIVSNGLLLTQVDDNIWNAIKRHDGFLNISLYPPTYAMKDKIVEFLQEKGIGYSFGSGLEQHNDSGIIQEFHKNLTDIRTHSPWAAMLKCMGNKCHFLRNGKISKCAIPLLAEDVNRALRTDYIITQDDFVDIYDDVVSPWDMVRKLYYAIPFCGYCSENGTERFPWMVKKDIFTDDYICTGVSK